MRLNVLVVNINFAKHKIETVNWERKIKTDNIKILNIHCVDNIYVQYRGWVFSHFQLNQTRKSEIKDKGLNHFTPSHHWSIEQSQLGILLLGKSQEWWRYQENPPGYHYLFWHWTLVESCPPRADHMTLRKYCQNWDWKGFSKEPNIVE